MHPVDIVAAKFAQALPSPRCTPQILRAMPVSTWRYTERWFTRSQASALHCQACMLITIDRNEVQVLHEILHGVLTQLRIESARADSHSYREGLHEREHIVEALLAKLSEENSLRAPG
jgi:neutral trehalase